MIYSEAESVFSPEQELLEVLDQEGKEPSIHEVLDLLGSQLRKSNKGIFSLFRQSAEGMNVEDMNKKNENFNNINKLL